MYSDRIFKRLMFKSPQYEHRRKAERFGSIHIVVQAWGMI